MLILSIPPVLTMKGSGWDRGDGCEGSGPESTLDDAYSSV